MRTKWRCFPSCASFTSLKEVDDDKDDWREQRRKEELAWTQIFSRLIAQWALWISNVVVGSRSRLGDFLHHSIGRRRESGEKIVAIDLSPLQEERLQMFRQRLEVPFDGTRLDHQESLRALWWVAFPNYELRDFISEQWKEMGWQGPDPSTDFRAFSTYIGVHVVDGCFILYTTISPNNRGGGFISLENMLFLAYNYPKSFQRLLYKQEGKRAIWEYPFAVAGINVSFMLIQMLDLRSAKPRSISGINFLKILAEDEMAFDMLYCVAFEVMDAEWLAMHASYMEFNEVLKSTRTQLEWELSLENIGRVQDLPSYNLLCQ